MERTFRFSACACVFLSLSLAASDDTKIVFPSARTPRSCDECDNKIPLEMALKLNTITNENQLFREFIKDSEFDGKGDEVEPPIVKAVLKSIAATPTRPDSVSDRFGDEQNDESAIERKAFTRPKPAGCIPELRSVSLRESADPWIYYWPSCTRIEQCGGCCSHRLLSCQPVEIELLNFQVVVTEYVGNQLLFKGKEIVTREKHTKCKCDCIVKEKDCNVLQEYRKGECRCVCKNTDAEAKCKDESRIKHWNPETCSCDCLQIFECSTGTYFDKSTCSCMPEDFQLDKYGYSDADNMTTTTQKTRRRRPWPINYFFGKD